MSYFKPIEKLKADANKKDRKSTEKVIARMQQQQQMEEDAKRRRKEVIDAVKNLKGKYQEMLELAHSEKDTIRYSYAVIVLSMIDTVDMISEKMPLDEIEAAVPKSIPTDIDLTEAERIAAVCPRFGGHSYISIPIHDDVKLKNYTVCDLAGRLQLWLKDSTCGKVDLFK